MSWDVLIQDFGDYSDVDAIPDDFAPKPLGARSALIADIVNRLPNADFSDPSWGMIDTADGSIEINIGDDELCDSIMLHVRGGDVTFQCVVNIVAVTPGRAFDMDAGEFFDPLASLESLGRSRE